MRTRFTAEEKRIRQTLARVKGYPRWRSTTLTGGFLYYLGSCSWVEEVFPYFDGTWSAGRRSNGTIRYFKSLQEALDYGTQLAAPRVEAKKLRQIERSCRILEYRNRLRKIR
jgi:hypothetical protein